MSGAEVIGVISAIVAILDAATKVYAAAKDASGLPSSFRSAAQRLPLVMDTLRAAKDGLKPTAAEDSYSSLVLVLESCEKKARSLQKVFQLVAPAPGASTPRRVATAMRALNKSKKVDELMKGIMDDIQLLAGNHAINSATRAQINDLTKAVESASASAVQISKHRSPRLHGSIVNYGDGAQTIHNGVGSQNITTGGAPQFNGTFTGSFSFSPPGTPPPRTPFGTPPPAWSP
ncbi:hypothetical protein B0T25DRAFT_552317 [Lasiosphaeria hispida]|uniref:NACHT-NTPase and P-loop NTPases N-terminal domain-containing protein n=1 Tax=Lasiosphaeria hispida TaxID=260671 RepID=A0AAJ0MAR7_9PEZI|nr:hypothetical protein B0T25DRAFT_552317 [Lasiosphaeria hispida]